MSVVVSANRVVRFGPFQVNIATRELRKNGTPLKLRPQAGKVLVLLLNHAGEMVTRDQLKLEIWGDGFFVDSEHGLNLCVRQIRAVLDDDPERPRYIETLPRQGYRFIARLEEAAPDSAHPSVPDVKAVLLETPAEQRSLEPEKSRPSRRVIAGALAGALAIMAALILGFTGPLQRLGFALHPAHIQSLAVLPLENLSHDPEQEYFADGMTDELITELAKVHALRVISRNSVMRYKGKHKPIPEVARELNVDAVVEGTITRSGDQVRITAQLIEAPTDRHLWADKYEGDLQNVLVLQDEVARAITKEVRISLTPQEQGRLTQARAVNPQAHEAYLKGRFHLSKRTDKDLKTALQLFQEAIDRDPNYPSAYSGLAYTYYLMSQYSSLPYPQAQAEADAAVRKALDLDPALAEAHAVHALILDVFARDRKAAESEYKQAIELDPNNSTNHEVYSMYLAANGRTAEGLPEARRAYELDPLSLRVNSVLCWQFYFTRQYDQAIQVAREGFELDSDYMPSHWCAGMAYNGKRDFSEAIRELQKTVALAGNTESQAWLGYVYATAGERAKALQILHRLQEVSKNQYVSPYQIAVIYTALGDRDNAFAWWEKAEQAGFDYVYLTAWPTNDNLRSDPRYYNLLHRIGVPMTNSDSTPSE